MEPVRGCGEFTREGSHLHQEQQEASAAMVPDAGQGKDQCDLNQVRAGA